LPLKVLALAFALVAGFALSACSSNESYKNENKPPPVLTVGIVIANDEITVGPNPFGAGPARFIVTNQTGKKQIVSFATDNSERKVLVDVNQTANFKQTVAPGFLGISASNTPADGVELTVGPERETAQQDLTQP
jgi:hypothetical protein